MGAPGNEALAMLAAGAKRDKPAPPKEPAKKTEKAKPAKKTENLLVPQVGIPRRE